MAAEVEGMVETKRAHWILSERIRTLLEGLERLPDSPELEEMRRYLEQMQEIVDRTLGQGPKTEPNE